MNSIVWKKRLSALLCTNLLTCTSLYVVSPLLPIYFVESIEHGGLAWSKAEACSLFGTFLFVLYVAPLLGGFVRDRRPGKRWPGLIGYIMALGGLSLLTLTHTPQVILGALICLALGSGFVKVSLAAMLGRLPKDLRTKGYDLHYNTSCMGFVSGALLSPFLFGRFFIGGVALFAIVGWTISLLCHLFFLNKHDQPDVQEVQGQVLVEPSSVNPKLFFAITIFGLLFFACFNQLLTSVPIYVHQSLNRTVGNFPIPALWFGAFGSVCVTSFSPFLRRYWNTMKLPYEQLFILKCVVGCVTGALAFGMLAAFVCWGGMSSFPAGGSIAIVAGMHILCYIADFHMRPTLLATATHCVASRHHTLATGFVYACIGLGGKSAGFLASYADLIGFGGVFGLCATGCLTLGFSLLLAHRYLVMRSRKAESVLVA